MQFQGDTLTFNQLLKFLSSFAFSQPLKDVNIPLIYETRSKKHLSLESYFDFDS